MLANGTSRRRYVSEAVEEALQQTRIEKPKFILVFSSIGYEQKDLLFQIRKQTQHCPLAGCSGHGAIGRNFADESPFALSLVAFGSDCPIELSAVSIKDVKDPETSGTILGEKISACLTSETKVVLLMTHGFNINFFPFAKAIRTNVPNSIPLIGGAASSIDMPNTCVYHNDNVYSMGAVAIALECKTIEWHISHGCEPLGVQKTITKAANNFIYEIDGKPTVEVLKEYLSPESLDRWKGDRTLISIALGFPSTQELRQSGYPELISRNIGIRHEENGSIRMQTEISSQILWIMRRDPLKIAERIEYLAFQLKKEEKTGKLPRLILQFDCAGRGRLLFREEQKLKFQNILQDCFTNVPWVGVYTHGEFAPINHKDYLHNYTLVLLKIY